MKLITTSHASPFVYIVVSNHWLGTANHFTKILDFRGFHERVPRDSSVRAARCAHGHFAIARSALSGRRAVPGERSESQFIMIIICSSSGSSGSIML